MREKKIVPRFAVAALFVVLCVAIGVWYWRVTRCHNGNPSLATFYVADDLSQQRRVIQTFQQFAETNSFSFGITYYTPDHDEFLMELTRKDTEIIAGNGAYSGKYDVHFYNYDCINPTTPADMEGLVNALKASISKIPGSKISSAP